MPANRRGFMQVMMALPGVAALLGKREVAAAAPARRDVYAELGVRPIINAAGTMTMFGGSLMAPEVVEAMSAAARQFVNIEELKIAIGKKIAGRLGCEAATVTCGAASALTVATAGCMTGKDLEKIARLPDTTGMKNEVLIQKVHRNGFDHAVRNAGARLTEVESSRDLERAVSPKTALMLFFNVADPQGKIKVQEFAQLGKKLGVPTLIDAAADVPPVENYTRFLKMGFDLAAFSGGKGLRGPQSTGLLLGRKDLVEAAALNSDAWRRLIDRLYCQEWLVYAKRPFGGAERVFRYLGRYSHRVAICNARLLALENDHVSFQYQDYAADNRLKVMRLSADEFIRRFLLHVLPKRFVRIRHYGLLAGRNVNTRLAHCRQLLAETTPPSPAADKPDWLDQYDWLEPTPTFCPHCHGPLVRRSLAVRKDERADTTANQRPRSVARPLKSSIPHSERLSLLPSTLTGLRQRPRAQRPRQGHEQHSQKRGLFAPACSSSPRPAPQPHLLLPAHRSQMMFFPMTSP